MIAWVLQDALTRIEAHARETYPEECCGALIGDIPGEPDDDLRIDEVRPLSNAWDGGGRSRRYELDPRELARVEAALGSGARGVLGIYHSHPDSLAWPSPFDLERAVGFYAYLIVSARKESVSDPRVWKLTPDGRSFAEIRLKLAQGTCFAKLPR